MLLISSYVFYGWWDWRFLSLILFSSLLDFYLGLRLRAATDPGKRKRLLIISMVVNLGVLFFFKYFNFFLGLVPGHARSGRTLVDLPHHPPGWGSASTRSRP